MATLSHLFKLPACIRGQAFAQLSAYQVAPVRQGLTKIAHRALSSSLKQNAQVRKPYQVPTASGSGRARLARSPITPSPSQPAFKAPPPSDAYAQSLLRKNDEVLLFKAPSHRSFSIFCISTGSFLLLGAYTLCMNAESVQNSSEDSRQSNGSSSLAYYTTYLCALIAASTATLCILAPAAVVTSIYLRAIPSASPGSPRKILLVLKTREWPFSRTKEIQLAPKQAFLDKRVSITGDEIEYTNVPVSQAENFTADPSSVAHPRAEPGLGLIGRAVKALMRDTRRMLLRDGFCRLRAGQTGNNWKVDLQDCELLDWGRPLERLTSEDDRRGVGVVAWIKRKMLSL